MDYKKVAQEINDALGQDNLQAAAHCATRLRLVLKDSGKVNQVALDNIDAVKGTFEVNGQFQIIIGAGEVNKVYKELVALTNVKEVSTSEVKEEAATGKKTKSNHGLY